MSEKVQVEAISGMSVAEEEKHVFIFTLFSLYFYTKFVYLSSGFIFPRREWEAGEKKSQTYTILSVKKYIGCCGKFKRKLSIEEEDFSSTFRGRKPRKNM